jgi:hypothetical protein
MVSIKTHSSQTLAITLSAPEFRQSQPNSWVQFNVGVNDFHFRRRHGSCHEEKDKNCVYIRYPQLPGQAPKG